MAMIFGWMGRGFGKLGAAGASKFSSGPVAPSYVPTYYILGF